jgi:AraC-like DNA-binding protein
MADRVRMWRPSGLDGVLLMEGQTTTYGIEPRGDYVFGVVEQGAMRSRRGRERRLVEAGQLVAWDPSAPHSGTGVDGRPWSTRLMVVEVGNLLDLVADRDRHPLVDVEFPQPVLSDPALVNDFRRLHAALERPTTRLEREERLAEWLAAVVDRGGTHRLTVGRAPGDERALRLALDYLRDHSRRNVGLDELAAAAGIGKFRLVRLVRDRTGLPPHSLQLAHGIRTARRLLEAGRSIAEVAAETGFADQSHLHRHFQRSLGLTPGEYQRRILNTSRRPLAPTPLPGQGPLP